MSPSDPAVSARTRQNPAKAASGHGMMHTRDYGTGGAYAFRERVGGVVPGYAGHRPGARDISHKMAYGGVPTFNHPRSRTPPGQGSRLDNRPTTSFQEYAQGWKVPEERPNEEYRDSVGGLLAGYTGFVPHSRTHFGSSHVGGLANVGYRAHLPQRGHEASVNGLNVQKQVDHSLRTQRTHAPVVGYQGHLPLANDAYGISYWRKGGSETERSTATTQPSGGDAHLYSAGWSRGR